MTGRQRHDCSVSVSNDAICNMKLLDLTLPTPVENVALDEALLDAAESGDSGEVLRLWEPAEHFVVAGRSSNLKVEIDLDACRRDRIAVVRRSSGGAAIVAGPGCLMYGVVLSYKRLPRLRMIDQAHSHVLGIVATALSKLGIDAKHQGLSDMVWNGRKISGNSLRCKRDHLLYHGTLLYRFDIGRISKFLRMPPRLPEYRAGREHAQFVANLPASVSDLRNAVITAFQAGEPATQWPQARVNELIVTRYTDARWFCKP